MSGRYGRTSSTRPTRPRLAFAPQSDSQPLLALPHLLLVFCPARLVFGSASWLHALLAPYTPSPAHPQRSFPPLASSSTGHSCSAFASPQAPKALLKHLRLSQWSTSVEDVPLRLSALPSGVYYQLLITTTPALTVLVCSNSPQDSTIGQLDASRTGRGLYGVHNAQEG